MAIVRESVTLSAGSENNVCTLNMPATRPDGDLYIAIICKDDDNLLTDPAGWNEVLNSAGTAGFTAAAYFGWRVGSSEPATYSFTHAGATEDWNGAVIRYSGVDTSVPLGSQTITPGTSSGGGGVSATFPVIAAQESDSKILRIFFGDSFAATGYSTGSGTFVTVNTNSGANMATVGFAQEDSPGAGVNTPACIFTTNGADDNAVVTYELLAGGAATITGSGTPAAQASTVAGTAERSITGSGTPSAQASTVAGTAERSVTGSGTLAAQDSTVAGTGTVATVFTGSGALAAQDSTVAGTAEREVTGSGTPTAQASTVAGTAERSIGSSGALAAQDSTVSGTAEREVTGSGTPTAQASTVDGEGTVTEEGDITGSGDLVAQASVVAGEGEVQAQITGSGVLVAQDSTVSGEAERALGATGALQAQSSTVSGTGERAVNASGALQAQSSTVSGTAGRGVNGSGTPTAQASTVAGTGTVDSASTPVVISDANDESFSNGESITVLGSGFGANISGARVVISPTNNINGLGAVQQTVIDWGSTAIDIVIVQGSLPLGVPMYLFVENNYGTSNVSGYVVQFDVAPPSAGGGEFGWIEGIEWIEHIA